MNKLFLNISDNQLFSEFKYYQNSIGKISSPNNKNYIVKYFQQDEFFKTEKILFQNKEDYNCIRTCRPSVEIKTGRHS